MNKRTMSAIAFLGVLSGGWVSAGVASADTVPSASGQTVQIEQASGGSIWDHVVGTAATWVECQAKLTRYLVKYGKLGACVPSPTEPATYLFVIDWP